MHMAQLMPLSLASVKSRLVIPLWYQLTWVVLEKGPLNSRVCVCARACVRVCFWGNCHVGLGKENDCARLHWDFHRLDAILSPCIKSLCTVFLSLLFMYCFYLVLMKGYFCGGHIWACPDCPWSIFSTLFGRWHQQCSLLLSVLHHLVDIFYTFCLY